MRKTMEEVHRENFGRGHADINGPRKRCPLCQEAATTFGELEVDQRFMAQIGHPASPNPPWRVLRKTRQSEAVEPAGARHYVLSPDLPVVALPVDLGEL